MSEEFTPVELTNTREDDYGRVASKSMFKQYDKEGTQDINAWKKIFVECMDPTEYAGGVALLGSWDAWLQFKRNWPSFKRLHLDGWLEEIEIRIKSQAVRSMINTSLRVDGTAAAKFLLEGKYIEKKAGRPSKEMIARELRISTAVEQDIANDLEKIKEYK